MVRRGKVLAWRAPATRQPDPAMVLLFCARGMIDTPKMPGASRPASAGITLHDDTLALAALVEPRGS